MNRAKKCVRRKVSPIGKLIILLLFILTLVFILCKCAQNKRIAKTSADDKKDYTGFSFKKSVMGVLDASDTVKYAERDSSTEELDIDSEYGILIDLKTNKILADKSGDETIYPASMTKVMTLIVAVENADSLDDTFTFTNEIIDPLVYEDASRAGFEADETVTVRDMLYGSILPSGADATTGLAIKIAGSEREFVKLMNEKANYMGLKNTHFVNTSGLHDKYHYSTAHDMALIMKYAMENETCREVLSAYTYRTSATEIHPEGIELYGTMLSRMYGDEAEGVTIRAGKTGYTTEGGNCLVSYAENTDGDAFILVTAKADGQWKPIYDAINTYAKYVGTGKVTIKQEGTDETSVYY